MKLNLGAGKFKKRGYVNVDNDKNAKPDVLWNLNKFPYPFSKNYFDLIEGDHVLEHLEEPFNVMIELHRILKPKGILIIKVPHASRGFTHPEHKRGFDVSFPLYFSKYFEGGYTGVKFNLVSMEMNWFAQPYLKKITLSPFQYYSGKLMGSIFSSLANLSPYLCSRIWCYWVGGFEEVKYVFRK
jgi:SAM-dependent methyltransferase